MSPATQQDAQDERITALELRMTDLAENVEGELRDFDLRLRRKEAAPGQTLSTAARRPQEKAGHPGPLPTVSFEPLTPPARVANRSLGDLVGGRVLAWLGGAATLLGIILFLVLAISHGWIGEQARVVMAAVASGALMAAGVWLHDHRGRTEAAVVMVGTATAGSFATLFMAAGAYHLIPGLAAVAGAIAVGAMATLLAVRWGRSAIGGLGLLGALLSAVLVGAPLDPTTLAILTVTAACAMWVVVRQQWGWLALGTVMLCAPQWGLWVLAGQPGWAELLVLVSYTALGLLGATGAGRGAGESRQVGWAVATASASACSVAIVGGVALAGTAGMAVGNLWLAALACVHLTAGSSAPRGRPLAQTLRHVLTVLGIVLADVAFGLSAHGIALAAGWSASGVLFAWVARRRTDERDAAMFRLGVGAQIALALIRVMIDAPPSGLLAGQPQLLGLASVAGLAAACIACGQMGDAENAWWRAAFDATGMAAIAYLTASALDGPPLVLALAGESMALAQLDARVHEGLTRFGALAFAGAAALCALAFDAPPAALLTGDVQLGDATLALGALAFLGLRAGQLGAPGSRQRSLSLIGAGVSLLYLASLAIVAAFGAASGQATESLFELGVRQQSQVALSALWSVAGVVALIVGLRRAVAPARTAGLALLLVTVGKVFLYDLSTLTSVYRVISFIVLGLLLLLGAFAYQRIRPPAPREARAPAS